MANFISVEDLIAAKPAAGRSQDIVDVDAIRKAAAKQMLRPATTERDGPDQRHDHIPLVNMNATIWQCAATCYNRPMDPVHSDHRRIDERSLAMHRLVAEKLRANPALLNEARDTLRRWQTMDGSPVLTLSEWENILSGTAVQVAQFQQSKRATRLRQSSPFAGLLTEGERNAIYESYSTRTYYSGRQPNRR